MYRSPFLGLIAIISALAFSNTVVLAQGDVSAAARAFSAAQAAELAEDHARAAEFYELAFGIVPSPEALRSAARARSAAGQEAIAASHAEEIQKRYKGDEKSVSFARDLIQRLAPKLMQVTVRCSSACSLAVDSMAASYTSRPDHTLYVYPGSHSITATFGDGGQRSERVAGGPGYERTLVIAAPKMGSVGSIHKIPRNRDEAEEPARARRGLSPWYFVTGIVATSALGAATLWSGLDILSYRDEYEENPTPSGYEKGEDLERRTNILMGTTAAVGAVTLAIGLFATKWKKEDRETTSRPDRNRVQWGIGLRNVEVSKAF